MRFFGASGIAWKHALPHSAAEDSVEQVLASVPDVSLLEFRVSSLLGFRVKLQCK